jgi:endogenous inhibitor of DNA gyrase (YacG/DUF329 family)
MVRRMRRGVRTLARAGAGADIVHMSEPPAPTSAKPCPICGKPAAVRFTPFCSSRCADVDLHRWLAGTYRVPVSEDDEGDEAPTPEPDEH